MKLLQALCIVALTCTVMHEICSSQAGQDFNEAFVLPDSLWRLEDSLLADKDLLLRGGRVVCNSI